MMAGLAIFVLLMAATFILMLVAIAVVLTLSLMDTLFNNSKLPIGLEVVLTVIACMAVVALIFSIIGGVLSVSGVHFNR